MMTPTITELARRLEAVTEDPFLDTRNALDERPSARTQASRRAPRHVKGSDMHHPATSDAVILKVVRYGLPAVLVLAGVVVLVVDHGSNRIDGFAMLVGAGLSVALLNALFRLGVSGERDRDDEERARRFFSEHGYWPDEKPSRQ
jgi:hypothetical protein